MSRLYVPITALGIARRALPNSMSVARAAKLRDAEITTNAAARRAQVPQVVVACDDAVYVGVGSVRGTAFGVELHAHFG
jgi:hypothetical protein